MSTHPIFDIEFTSTTGKYPTDVTPMSFLHMSHRFGPVTTNRLLAGETVERYSRDRVRIVGMTLKEKPEDSEPAL